MNAYYYLSRLTDQIENELGKMEGNYLKSFGCDPKVGDPVLAPLTCQETIRRWLEDYLKYAPQYTFEVSKCYVPGFIQFNLKKHEHTINAHDPRN